MTLKTFTYNNELYIRVVPAKNLFNSTMVHEVVNRGDVFAVRVSDSKLTIVPGQAAVTHSEHHLLPTAAQLAKELKAAEEATVARKKLKELGEQMKLELK